MALSTFGDLRKALQAEGLRWTVNPRMDDATPLRMPPLGALTDKLPLAANLPRVDVAALVRAQPPANPALVSHLIAAKVLAEGPALERRTISIADIANIPAGGTPASRAVDWRNRWGWNWICGIRDQDPCEACWAFAATALVESMVRIEHAVWSKRSEADVFDGMGSRCGDCGNAGSALDWMKANGVSDPDCYDWPPRDSRTSSYFNPAPDKCGGGSMVSPKYTPKNNRSGRTTRIGDYTNLGNIDDQKNWIDHVGPLVVGIDCYDDFGGWSGTTPYKKSSHATFRGGHVMLAVGFDDHLQCWIVKNSWGPNLGNDGYWLIGYGECNIDMYGKLGLQGTNPDPWIKRRLHGGAMIESGNGGTHRNFEMLATKSGNHIAHWWRDNTAAGFPWACATTFGNDAAACPTLTSTTYNRNFESVHLTTGHRLHHWWFNQTTHTWTDGGVFGPTDAAGVPGFLESNYGPGNFEVVVRTADGRLNHWWRDNSFVWHDGGRFGDGVAYSGGSLIQGDFGNKGNLELVCVVSSGQMQHWWRADDAGFVWHASVTFGAHCASAPCMIQGQYGMGDEYAHGNFELCVAITGGQVEHWWRSSSNFQWTKSATFGHNVQAVVSLVEGSFGFNLELIVLRTDGMLQHYWRDGSGWHEGVVIGSTH